MLTYKQTKLHFISSHVLILVDSDISKDSHCRWVWFNLKFLKPLTKKKYFMVPMSELSHSHCYSGRKNFPYSCGMPTLCFTRRLQQGPQASGSPRQPWMITAKIPKTYCPLPTSKWSSGALKHKHNSRLFKKGFIWTWNSLYLKGDI